MLYAFTKKNLLLPPPEMNGLIFRENKDSLFMAQLGEIAPEGASKRFAAGHKAYVAYLDGTPAAFGWLATEKARIGELNHEFKLPQHQGYLWNFRTLPAFRGLGIYPHLLQYILATAQNNTDTFWIMHAPENKASQRGILKAGFNFIGKVSVINGSEVIFTSGQDAMPLDDILSTFGFTRAEAEPATCWNCSSPYLKNRKPVCCCSAEETECTQNIFLEA